MIDLAHVYETIKGIYIDIAEGPYAMPSLMFGFIGVALVAITVLRLGSDDRGHPR